MIRIDPWTGFGGTGILLEHPLDGWVRSLSPEDVIFQYDKEVPGHTALYKWENYLRNTGTQTPEGRTKSLFLLPGYILQRDRFVPQASAERVFHNLLAFGTLDDGGGDGPVPICSLLIAWKAGFLDGDEAAPKGDALICGAGRLDLLYTLKSAYLDLGRPPGLKGLETYPTQKRTVHHHRKPAKKEEPKKSTLDAITPKAHAGG